MFLSLISYVVQFTFLTNTDIGNCSRNNLNFRFDRNRFEKVEFSILANMDDELELHPDGDIDGDIDQDMELHGGDDDELLNNELLEGCQSSPKSTIEVQDEEMDEIEDSEVVVEPIAIVEPIIPKHCDFIITGSYRQPSQNETDDEQHDEQPECSIASQSPLQSSIVSVTPTRLDTIESSLQSDTFDSHRSQAEIRETGSRNIRKLIKKKQRKKQDQNQLRQSRFDSHEPSTSASIRSGSYYDDISITSSIYQRQSTGISVSDDDVEVDEESTAAHNIAHNLDLRENREIDLQQFCEEHVSMEKLNVHIDLTDRDGHLQLTDENITPALNEKKESLVAEVDKIYNKMIQVLRDQQRQKKNEIIADFQGASKRIFCDGGLVDDIIKIREKSAQEVEMIR